MIENILEMYEKIEDVSEQLKSKDVEVFLASQDRLTESVEYLRRNSSNIGAAEKLAELESRILESFYCLLYVSNN